MSPPPPPAAPAQPSPAQPCRCLVSYLVLPGVCLLSPSLEGRCLLGPPACPLRSSGVVSLLEPELSDALISFGQKSPFCKMLALSPYIPRAHTHTHTRTHTHTHTHTHTDVCFRPCVSVSIYMYIDTPLDTHARARRHLHRHVGICALRHMYTDFYGHVCIHTHVRICVDVCAHLCTCSCV